MAWGFNFSLVFSTIIIEKENNMFTKKLLCSAVIFSLLVSSSAIAGSQWCRMKTSQIKVNAANSMLPANTLAVVDENGINHLICYLGSTSCQSMRSLLVAAHLANRNVKIFFDRLVDCNKAFGGVPFNEAKPQATEIHLEQ